MGADIDGFIEVRPWTTWRSRPSEVRWQAAVRLDCLYEARHYDAFGCLFGVMNFAGFRPVAADRGLPADTGDTVRETHLALGEQAHWTTWVGWPEIRAVDWDEPAERADARLHEYRRGDDGRWRYTGKASWSRAAFAARGVDPPPPGTPPEIFPVGTVWTDGDFQVRAERLTRRDAVPANGEWRPVWEVMEVLGRLHGDENCRLVVWFDT